MASDPTDQSSAAAGDPASAWKSSAGDGDDADTCTYEYADSPALPPPADADRSVFRSSTNTNSSLRSTVSSGSSSGGGGGGVLRGTLLYRRNMSAKKVWKSSMRMYAVLDMSSAEGASSLTCYRFENLSKKEANAAYGPTELVRSDGSQGMSNVRTCLELPAHLPWTVRDVANDPAAFMVEIPVEEGLECLKSRQGAEDTGAEEASVGPTDSYDDDDADDDDYDYENDEDDDGMYIFWGDGDGGDNDGEDDADVGGIVDSTRTESTAGSAKYDMDVVPNQVEVDLLRAASRRRPYVRYALRCPTKRNEKALWLTALQKVGRLQTESRRKRSIFGATSTIRQNNSRIRRGRGVDLARQSMKLDKDAIGGGENDNTVGSYGEDGNAVKEYRVRPSYNYPHRWMINEELTDEMLCPSAEVHDLRLPPAQAPERREVGLLRVEVLQCLGLPRPKGKTASINPSPVVYLICGPYAFATDVVPQCTEPMWLRSMRRACQIPIHHGYARLFVGVFHDDGSKGPRDLFIGRAVVDISRLRPGATYDVTLPLRQSVSVYSRRKRGAVRLRFDLDMSDAKQFVLSYLPSKRNRLGGQVGTTTVACADPKAFRNCALTVNGIHLPGKFSTDHFMALIREFKLVQKVVRQLSKQFVEDLVSWRYPVKSAFAFLAWMHCLYVNSATLIPVYIVSFTFLQLVTNYARCIIGGAAFRPATWEEIFTSLTGSSGKPGSGSCAESGTIHSLDGIVDKYDPIGRSIFTLLGFVGKTDEYFVGDVDTWALDEFPYASLAGYPRLSVDEAVVKAPANPSPAALELKASASTDADVDEYDEGDGGLEGIIDSNAEEYQPRIFFKKRIPQQNIDVKVKGDGKTIADELQEIEEKIQKATKYVFRDDAYLITDRSQPPFGKRTRESNYTNIERDLNKLLGIGQFSQWNPIVTKYSVQFEPLIRIFCVVLSLYRSIYNIFTWRDPYLSFWVSLLCLVTTVVMVMFPWRPCLFVVGLVALGPQNWIVRLFREQMRSSDDSSNRPSRFLRAFRELVKSSDDDEEDDKSTERNQKLLEGDPQPLFFAHAPASKPISEPRTKDTVGTQHVVVPYSPLLSQRFYDWPPDPKYARVLKATSTSKDGSTLRTSAKEITTKQIMPSMASPRSSGRQEAREKMESTQVEKKAESSPPTSPPRPPASGSGSRDEDDEEPRLDRIDADSALSVGSDDILATDTSMATANTRTTSISKATSTLTANASRSMGGLSKSIAKKSQVLTSSLKKKSVNFNDDVSMLSTASDNAAGKGKMSKIMKSAKLPGNIMKSKKGPRIGEEICVPEDASEDDWLKMPETEDSANNRSDAAQNEGEARCDETALIPSIDSTLLDNVKEALHETENGVEDIVQPVDTIYAGDTGNTNTPSQADQGDAADEAASNDSDADKDAIPSKVGDEEGTMHAGACEEVHADVPLEGDGDAKENDETYDYNEGESKDVTPQDESIGTVANASSSPLTDDAMSLANDNAELLKTLMEVKLELASVRTENDHHQARLKETEKERDFYKKKYNECMEGRSTRDLQVPNWLADGEDGGSLRGPQQPGQQQPPSGGFKINISSMSSPFRKQSP